MYTNQGIPPMTKRLTKAELAADRARLDAWIATLNADRLQAKARQASREDRLIDRGLIGWS